MAPAPGALCSPDFFAEAFGDPTSPRVPVLIKVAELVVELVGELAVGDRRFAGEVSMSR